VESTEKKAEFLKFKNDKPFEVYVDRLWRKYMSESLKNQ
jgi:hypothetical protein